MKYKSKIINGKEYFAICKNNELLEGKGIKIQFDEDDDMQVAIFRINGELYCLSNICPHRHAEEIYNGIIKDGNVTCPLHGWTYNLKSGANVNLKQGLKSLQKFEIFELNKTIYIEKPPLIIPKWRQSE
ncbi:MAG: Rieske 2Fe-2S domain-containing protein [Candidatus Kapabacteria bacterium]|nr:Rieske 2Fe-2S domain-containing protein [Candidatus Kapabacteria bacterium]